MSRRNRPSAGRPATRPPLLISSLLQQAAAARAHGLLERAERLCRSVLEVEPANLEASQLLGVIALQGGRSDEALALLVRAAELHPVSALAQANLGTALTYLRRPEEALRHYEHALELDPRFAVVLNNLGNAQRSLKRHSEAAESFRRLYELAPSFEFALGNRFRSLRQCCDWREFEALRTRTLASLESGTRIDRPFSLLSVTDSTALQRTCARTYGAYLCRAPGAPLWRGERYAHERIRVAYLSADFRDHAVSYVMAPLFERHDSEHFHTIGVALAAEDGSEIVARCKRALGEFVNVAGISDEQAAQLLRSLEVDIAVDLTGFTEGCRPGIFAHRPAPAHASLIGFPGTLGVPYMDYIIADDFVIPEALESGYSEKVIRLPDCFQPNDALRAELQLLQAVPRSAAGLPDDALVLCCFNNSYKLNPPFFDVWMRLLQRAPRTVLWLLGDDAVVRANLLKEAAARGIGGDRLVFAPRVTYREHLARVALADLCLDTLPFNGGATASDALRAGVPLLTCAGEAFAARMAGSLLRAVGLPELVTSSIAEYERRALELLEDPSRLRELRATLAAQARTAPLFDTARYCGHLEDAYREMSARAARGEPPVSFSLAPDRPQTGTARSTY
ncbi:MAG TPA: tetratricopeptide repeat protein [Steroidobacteraceae bacterium]|nr:tetratricopeptide repeat protein [Steroidobacteraceae bacterium]